MNIALPLLWFIPAYVANAAATLSRLFPRVHPMDFGLSVGGARILGDGKTWEGFLTGFFLGVASGFLVRWIFDIGVPTGIVLLSIGALLGDVLGSFVKRRVGLPRGAEAPVMDQLDFVTGAFLLYPPTPDYGILIVVLTPLLHRAANLLGHRIGVKHEPW